MPASHVSGQLRNSGPSPGPPPQTTPIVMVGDQVQLFRTFSNSTSADGSDHKTVPDPNEEYETISDLLFRYPTSHADENEKDFWPYAQLRRILTPDRVRIALVEECGYAPDLAEAYCTKILAVGDDQVARDSVRWRTGAGGPVAVTRQGSGYLRIFAVLLMQGKGKLVQYFIDQGVSDDDLPLEVLRPDRSAASSPRSRRAAEELARPVPPEPRPRSWFTWSDVKLFEDRQWQVLPPFFSPGAASDEVGVPHYDLPAKAVLPWVELQGVDGRQATWMGRDEGGSGLVKRVKIDPDCHNLDKILDSISAPNEFFAVKSLRKQDLKQFQQEVEMLKRFSGREHPHLVTLLATFTYRGFYHFIFPYAEYDLDDWWARCKSPPQINEDFMIWVAKQLAGVAEALHVIHEPRDGDQRYLTPGEEKKFGRHGDLKPENVLWFASRSDPLGMLVISDFGISAVHRDVSRSNVPNENLPRTPTYRPPECDIEGGKIARAFDIWTMGCLLLEMACWLLGGADGRKQFKDKRTTIYLATVETDIYFDIQETEEAGGSTGEGSKRGGRYVFLVKESVMQYMESLHAHPFCTGYLHDLLRLVHEETLVVLSPTRQRIRAGPLARRLEAMHQRARRERTPYVVQGRPWAGHRIERPPAVEAQLIEHTRKLLLAGQQSLRQRLAIFRTGATEVMSTMQFTEIQGD